MKVGNRTIIPEKQNKTEVARLSCLSGPLYLDVRVGDVIGLRADVIAGWAGRDDVTELRCAGPPVTWLFAGWWVQSGGSSVGEQLEDVGHLAALSVELFVFVGELAFLASQCCQHGRVVAL